MDENKVNKLEIDTCSLSLNGSYSDGSGFSEHYDDLDTGIIAVGNSESLHVAVFGIKDKLKAALFFKCLDLSTDGRFSEYALKYLLADIPFGDTEDGEIEEENE